MRRDAREWTVPGSFRALLWWPPVSLMIGIVAPDAAVVAIIVAGFVLALTGVLVHALGARLRRRPAASAPRPRPAEPAEFDAAA
ncbi:hypothetical protein [Pseudonocardia thermophila]|jgi:hypothetical protein|uniref:hypothetical protein n=1 Tax=Pseudonocardia thermophila TaxID=1848 RepID=UPI00248D78BA|nr:hypothetical protein [Pseudonocardia thermophila]